MEVLQQVLKGALYCADIRLKAIVAQTDVTPASTQ